MTFKRIVVERIVVTGPKGDLPAARDWCSKNGYAVEDEISRNGGGCFNLRVVRLINPARNRWTATAAQLRRKP